MPICTIICYQRMVDGTHKKKKKKNKHKIFKYKEQTKNTSDAVRTMNAQRYCGESQIR